jgi:hypothetical protein
MVAIIPSVQPAPFVDLAITPDGLGLWTLDQTGEVQPLGAAPVLASPPDPVHSPYAALVSTPTGWAR